MGHSSSLDPHDVFSNFLGRLVLPVAPNSPAALRQLSVGPPIPSDVGVEFLRPPLSIGHWASCVLGTAMPEASVDEYCELETPPGDICSSTKVGLELDVRAES